MALPFSITANILYFFKYDWFRPDDPKQLTRLDKVLQYLYVPQHNDNMNDDIENWIRVFYYRRHNDQQGWRSKYMLYVHVIPLICLSVDMMHNRIKMRFLHIVLMIMLLSVYILQASNIGGYLQYNTGAYFDNLKFDCPQNYHYLYDNFPQTDGQVVYQASEVIDN